MTVTVFANDLDSLNQINVIYTAMSEPMTHQIVVKAVHVRLEAIYLWIHKKGDFIAVGNAYLIPRYSLERADATLHSSPFLQIHSRLNLNCVIASVVSAFRLLFTSLYYLKTFSDRR